MLSMTSRSDTEALWRESSARLGAWFARETGSASDADDLLQETFVRVHERLDTLIDAASVRGWVATIARNVLADHHRRHGSAEASVDDQTAAQTGRDPIERTVAAWLEGFIDQLDPHDAEALRFVDLGGRTQAELAERAGLTLSAAKSRVQRARAKLRERLEACCGFAFDARGGILSVEKRASGRCTGDGCG
jgi:RNA polymerase sigma-70 factor (ECF subfamily)